MQLGASDVPKEQTKEDLIWRRSYSL